MKRTQKQDVLNYLKRYKSITSLKAIQLYGATRLSGIIYTLRSEGYDIKTDLKNVKTRYGNANIAVYKYNGVCSATGQLTA